MAKTVERQDDLVEVRHWLPRSARDELDARAQRQGLRRSTLLRTIVLRDNRAAREEEGT